MRRKFVQAALAVGIAIPLASLVGAPIAGARCTDQIDYAGDPRSNAEINGIGATTGQCPTPQTGVANDVQGLVRGAVEGQACSNFESYVFGETASGGTTVCSNQGDGTGVWVRAIPVVGTRPLGSSCVAGFSLAAQTPDGIPMICGDDGTWIRYG